MPGRRSSSYSLKVTPAEHFVNWQQDPSGNWLARFVFPEPVTEFRIEVDLVTELSIINPFDFFVETDAETFPFAYPEELRAELAPYLVTEPPGPLLEAFLATIPREPTNTVNFIVDLNARLAQGIAYGIRMEPGVQEPEHTLAIKSGSCRDTSWLLVQILRHLGFAARFVSGYLIQMKADIDPLEGPARHRQGLHRPARLGRGLHPRRRLDRPRSDLGPADRRGPSAAGGDAALPLRRARQRRRELCRDRPSTSHMQCRARA